MWKSPKNWQAKRRKVLDRDRWTCQVCLKRVGPGYRRAHVHHRTGRKSHALRNLVTLCASCHKLVTELTTNSKALTFDRKARARLFKLAMEYLKASSASTA